MTRNVLITNFSQLGDRNWRFFHETGHVATEFFRFLPDGRISGYSHYNETFWMIENETLSITNADREITVTFNTVEVQADHLLLKGRHIPDPSIVLCLQEQTDGRARHSTTRYAFCSEISTMGWSIGHHTYGLPHVIEKGLARLVIGKYCSIGDGVRISLGNHRTDLASTYPFKALENFWEHVPQGISDKSTKGDVIIGNDVWIGEGVFILSGVTVGDGAVLGAGAVVVKNVPPYAIVVGNPGRIAKFRFDEPTIKRLLCSAWWTLDDQTIDSILPVLLNGNLDDFLRAIDEVKSGLQTGSPTKVCAD